MLPDPSNIATSSPGLYLYTSAPAAPVLTAPADASTGISLKPTFSWQAVAQTYTYNLQIATDPDFTHIVHSATGLQTTSYTGPSLSQNTVYYWRVVANNPCGAGSYSTIFSFRTQIPPDCAELMRNGTFEAGRTEWTEVSSGGYAIIGQWSTPHLGTWYAWMGGYKNANDSIRQTVTIPANATGSLTYWYYITSDDSCGYDLAGVQVGGVNVANYDLCTTTSMTAYAQHSIDMSAYAGASREIRFWATDDKNFYSSFMIDDVSLVMCVPAAAPATVCGISAEQLRQRRLPPRPERKLFGAWGTPGNQDGIVGFTNFRAGETSHVQVSVQGTSVGSRFLRLWFDWNSNNVFDEDERVYSAAVVDGVNTLNVAVPAGLTAPVKYRFRLYDGAPLGIMAQDDTSFGDADGGDIADGESPDPTPTAVTLARFEAAPQGGAILLTWETAMELDNAGFNLYRGATSDGPWTQLNAGVIPPQQPGMLMGAVYEWLDTDVQPGVVYDYRLEDLDTKG